MKDKLFTYRDMTKQSKRDAMNNNSVSSLGTQSGGFGVFHEHFRVVSREGSEKLREEVVLIAEMLGKEINELIDEMPTLQELLK